MDYKTVKVTPTISMEVVKDGSGSYGVSLLLTGLHSQQQAEAAIAYMQQIFCGQEIRGDQ